MLMLLEQKEFERFFSRKRLVLYFHHFRFLQMHQILGKPILIKWEWIVSSLLQYCFFLKFSPSFPPPLRNALGDSIMHALCCWVLQSECAWKMADTMKSFLWALLKCLEMDHIFQRGLHSHVAPTRESHEPGKSDLRKPNVNKVLRISHRLFQGLFLLLPKSITFSVLSIFLPPLFYEDCYSP